MKPDCPVTRSAAIGLMAGSAAALLCPVPAFARASPLTRAIPSSGAQPVKPSSDFTIEITPPSLAMPAAGAMERVPWYAKAALVLLVVGGGGYAWWSTQGLAAPSPGRCGR